MTPSINPNSEIFLSNLEAIQSRMSRAQQQLSSGLRVSVASDDPDQISSILQLRAQIASVQQTQQNVANVTPQVQGSEEAIQQAIQVLDTATSLATQASGSTLSTDQRQDLVPQVRGILSQLVSLSQTAVNGQYVFSGDQGSQPQYTLSAGGDAVQQVFQAGSPPAIEDANGVKIALGLTAQQIFDDQDSKGKPTAANAFAAVSGLLTALETNDTAGIETALSNIQASSNHLNDQSSFYGASLNNLTAAGSAASTTLITLQKQLSNEQDADTVQAALDMTQATVAQQAAMSAQAILKPQSLFNYLG